MTHTVRRLRARIASLACTLVLLAGSTAPALSEHLLSLDVRDADVVDVIRLLALESQRNIIVDHSVTPARATIHLRDVPFETALRVVMQAYDLQLHRDGSVLIVGSGAEMNRRYGAGDDALGPQTVDLPTGNAEASEVAAGLTAALPKGTVVVANTRAHAVVVTGDAATVRRARALVRAMDGSAVGRRTVSIALQGTSTADALAHLSGVLPKDAARADERRNAIVVTGDDGVIATAQAYLRALDRPTPQVMFEVKVVDVTLANDNANIGVIFGGPSGTPGSTTYTFANRTIPIQATLNALISENRASILATPRVATLNNKEANLRIGTSYPIVTTTTTGTVASQNVTYLDIGVNLRLTPSISEDGTIIAEMHPQYSVLQGLSPQGYPITANRQVDSTLRVHSDETIVLGGLFSDITSETVTKVPLLGDIPILGQVFRNRQKSHQKDDVVFLITPHVL